ncbi:hypothetical protein JQN72_17565 [Phycicoccus sp. CSK15P-2]|uniref:esterase/lipase family protein n=1 Tax=Phycicoccus sp. CSK15P-2 TaxID=2807627 RepID=UPI00194E5244|nr:hypothetical protein [Phycicoccus sp. CSK15P-2]MBM6406048.1 hypothetical protein [Phycicoccus sp. CSK15P-2]
MSPRRRAALVGLVAAVVLAVAGVVGWARLGPGGVPQDEPGPVLLVAGYGGDTGSLAPLAAALEAGGRRAAVVAPVGDGRGDLREQAEALDRAVDDALSGGAPSVDVVGYSAGGVVARLWAADLGGADRARRVVTLGSPHHGTEVASLGAVLAGPSCPEACRQLAAGSDLLAGLPETPRGPRWVSVRTDADEVVTPASSARLAGAVDVRLQAVCPDAGTTHGGLPRDPLVVGVVARALAVAVPGPVPPSACADLRREGDALLDRAAVSS